MIQTTKKLTMVVCVVTIMIQVISANSALAAYNADMERLYGTWAIPNSGYSMEITEDTIAGEGYIIIEATDSGKMILALLDTGNSRMELLSYDGKNLTITINGKETNFRKYYRGDDGKMYPY